MCVFSACAWKPMNIGSAFGKILSEVNRIDAQLGKDINQALGDIIIEEEFQAALRLCS